MLKVYILILLLLLSTASYGQQLTTTFENMSQSDSKSLGSNATDFVVGTNTDNTVKYLAELYKRALVRERLGAYDNALGALSLVNSKAAEILKFKGNFAKTCCRCSAVRDSFRLQKRHPHAQDDRRFGGKALQAA